MQIKIVLVFITLLITSTSYATLSWNEIKVGSRISFNQNFSIKNTNFLFKKNTTAFLVERITLKMLTVEMLKIKTQNCKMPSKTSSLELYEIIQPNNELVVVGMELLPQCVLEIFVEKQDLNSNSIFK